MNNKKLARVLNKSLLKLKKSSPTILSCVASVGVIATVILAIKATSKAIDSIEEAGDEKADNQWINNEEITDLTIWETVGVAWKYYIPTIIVGTATITCIIGANALNKKQQEALTSAYILLESSYREYTNKVKEIYGDEVDRNIRNSIIDEKFVEVNNGTVNENDEKFIFYEQHHDSFFEMSMADFYHTLYHINRNFQLRGYTTLNEFYEFLGIDTIPSGDVLGWSCDYMYANGLVPMLDFNLMKRTLDDGLEYYIIYPDFEPTMKALEDYT